MSNYFTLAEAGQFTFFRIPKALFENIKYERISTDAKVLYGVLLDRMGLSVTNNWVDKMGHVYIYYTVESIEKLLQYKQDKIRKLFRERESVDLIERKQQGLGKPNKIYVKQFISDHGKTAVKATKNPQSASRKKQPCDYDKTVANNTELIKNNFSNTNSSINKADYDEMTDRIKKNIEYNILAERYSNDAIDEIVWIIVDVICGKCNCMKVGNSSFPHEVVKSRFLKLNAEHVEYVLDRLKQNTTKINNIKSYLITALYNAPATMDHYYQSEVNHDLYGTD